MPREHIDYRPNLELLKERFPGKDMLDVDDMKTLTGRSTATIYRNWPMVNGLISIAVVARRMCEDGGGKRR